MSLSRHKVRHFVTTGKNDAAVAIGCGGGRHTSVKLVLDMADRFQAAHLADTEGEARIVVTVLHRKFGARRASRIMTGAGSHR